MYALRNLIDDLWYIVTGYTNLFLHFLGKKRYTPAKRYYLCQRCPHRKKFTCGICGCVIMAKVWADYPISEVDGKSIGGCPLVPPRW